jgi:hypothetical protein
MPSQHGIGPESGGPDPGMGAHSSNETAPQPGIAGIGKIVCTIAPAETKNHPFAPFAAMISSERPNNAPKSSIFIYIFKYIMYDRTSFS